MSRDRVGDRWKFDPVKSLLFRSILPVAVLGVVTLGLIACTTETDGSPSPAVTQPATISPTLPSSGPGLTASTSQSGLNQGDSPIKNTDPCTLLTVGEGGTLGVGPAKQKDQRSCEWTASGQFVIQVNTYNDRGLKDVVATGEIKPVPRIGKHDAVQSAYGSACVISIKITETSRVDTTASANADSVKSCQIAMRAAQVVEPKLPGGS